MMPRSITFPKCSAPLCSCIGLSVAEIPFNRNKYHPHPIIPFNRNKYHPHPISTASLIYTLKGKEHNLRNIHFKASVSTLCFYLCLSDFLLLWLGGFSIKNLVQYSCYKAVELRNTVYFGCMPPNESLVLTQLKWISTYKNSLIMQGHILLHCTS